MRLKGMQPAYCGAQQRLSAKQRAIPGTAYDPAPLSWSFAHIPLPHRLCIQRFAVFPASEGQAPGT